MVMLSSAGRYVRLLGALCLVFGLLQCASASLGDRLPEFHHCLEVCKQENCLSGRSSLPLHLRLLLWTCSSECDHHCQMIVTRDRLAADPPMLQPIVQFHGKWPFYRLLGIQEPFSVLFSLLNFLAHRNGLKRVRASIPEKYPLRPYYIAFGYFGLASWVFSMIFHTRDFYITEKMDYFAAGASVMYGMYYTPIRIFRLDEPKPAKQSFLRFWTVVCIGLYAAHVTYLTAWTWDYGYNMAANVAVGMTQNLLWIWYSVLRFSRLGKTWTLWPAMIIVWIMMAMSLELFDFPPIAGLLDAHSLWHAGTVIPCIWWYSFLLKDTQNELATRRLKA